VKTLLKTLLQALSVFGAFFAGVLILMFLNSLIDKSGIFFGALPRMLLAVIPIFSGRMGYLMVKRSFSGGDKPGRIKQVIFWGLALLGMLGSGLMILVFISVLVG
jgi:hypothetical protein